MAQEMLIRVVAIQFISTQGDFSMRKSVLTLSVRRGARRCRTLAAAAGPSPPHRQHGHLFSEYRFRGISQTNEKPAIQGGFDYAHASGFYARQLGLQRQRSAVTGRRRHRDGLLRRLQEELRRLRPRRRRIYYYYPGANPAGVGKSTTPRSTSARPGSG